MIGGIKGNMNNIGEKYLPVGTVVMLKGAKKRLMITGFAIMDGEKKNNKIFDYCGCLYPEGVVNTSQNAVFDHEQIERVDYYGFRDQEEIEFKTKLVQLVAANPIVDNVNNTVTPAAGFTVNSGSPAQPQMFNGVQQ